MTLSFNKYNFDLTNLYDLLNTRNIWDLIHHNNKLNEILSEERIKPDITLTPSTFDNYAKFIDGHIHDKVSDVLVNYWYSHVLKENIIDNLYINFSTDLYNRIKEAVGSNPSFMDEILLNNMPKYEVKIFFNAIKAERDLYNVLYKHKLFGEYKFKRIFE